MGYSFSVHIIGSTDKSPGHSFIELKSPTGSVFYELNANEPFIGPRT